MSLAQSTAGTQLIRMSDIRELISIVGVDEIMDQCIDRLRQALEEYDPELVDVRERDGFIYESPHPGLVEWMPVMDNHQRALVKLVGFHPRNPTLHFLPTILSTLCLYDLNTGHLLSMADGVFSTAVRTGAASAIATDLFATQSASVLGLVGCGAQAVTQMHAISRVRKLKKVLVFDVDDDAVSSFEHRANIPGIEIIPVSIERLEAESDIICTVTSITPGHGPVLPGENLKPHVHINAVGSDLPGKCELPLHVVESGLVIPDFLAQALREGECQRLELDQIGPLLHEFMQDPGSSDEYRQSLTVFDSTGFALEDLVMMTVLRELCQQFDLGVQVDLENINVLDPRDPYLRVGARELVEISAGE